MSSVTLSLATATLTAAGGPQTLTATVTNSAAVPARIVLGAFGSAAAAAPGTPNPLAWTAIDQPLRTIAAGGTEQYTITVAPPPGTAAGQYRVRLIAYDADRPPEEYSDQAQHLEIVVPSSPPAAGGGIPWWVYAIAAVLVAVIAVVAYFVLRPAPEPPLPSPSPSPTPTSSSPSPSPSPSPPNPCSAPYVPRLTRPEDLTCVTALSAAEAAADNDPALQTLRKDPGGAYGPESCVQGYVWREAFVGDVVCVLGSVRTRTYWENRGYPEGRP